MPDESMDATPPADLAADPQKARAETATPLRTPEDDRLAAIQLGNDAIAVLLCLDRREGQSAWNMMNILDWKLDRVRHAFVLLADVAFAEEAPLEQTMFYRITAAGHRWLFLRETRDEVFP
jgi:hypothetical protein